jgi:Histidine kinase-like ATPase domain
MTGSLEPGSGTGPAGGGTAAVPAAVRFTGRTAVEHEAPAPVLPSQPQGHGQPDGWPLRSYLELGALPSAVPCARLHTRQVTWEWGLGELAEAVELVVSEMVTNAVQASKGLTASRYTGRWMAGIPPVRLWLGSDKKVVLIQVWDADPRMPTRRGNDLEAEDGRGLLLVEALCEEWGAVVPQGSSGKVVWAVCPRQGEQRL